MKIGRGSIGKRGKSQGDEKYWGTRVIRMPCMHV